MKTYILFDGNRIQDVELRETDAIMEVSTKFGKNYQKGLYPEYDWLTYSFITLDAEGKKNENHADVIYITCLNNKPIRAQLNLNNKELYSLNLENERLSGDYRKYTVVKRVC